MTLRLLTILIVVSITAGCVDHTPRFETTANITPLFELGMTIDGPRRDRPGEYSIQLRVVPTRVLDSFAARIVDGAGFVLAGDTEYLGPGQPGMPITLEVTLSGIQVGTWRLQAWAAHWYATPGDGAWVPASVPARLGGDKAVYIVSDADGVRFLESPPSTFEGSSHVEIENATARSADQVTLRLTFTSDSAMNASRLVLQWTRGTVHVSGPADSTFAVDAGVPVSQEWVFRVPSGTGSFVMVTWYLDPDLVVKTSGATISLAA